METIFDKFPKLLDPGFVDGYDFPSCWTAMDRNNPYDELDVAAALISSMGILGGAARLLNRSRRSLEGYVVRTRALSELMEDIQSEFIDAVEHKFRLDALGMDASARRTVLTTLGKDRGYVTRVESTGKDGAALQHEVIARDAADFTNKVVKMRQNAIRAVEDDGEAA